ncbi:Imm42 family immunity protein [Achromobacter xylosoxidans]
MIYGDPFNFAIQYDVVKVWNENENFWKNGLFFIYVGGEKIGLVDVVELKTTIGFYKRCGGAEVEFYEDNIKFRQIYNAGMSRFYGDDTVVPGSVGDLTCTAFGDCGLFLFYAKTQKSDVLVWGGTGAEDVKGKVFPLGTVASVLQELPGDI